MFELRKNLDIFTKNIIIVFAGSTLVNFFNLLYQLLIAHRLSAPDFAAFNSLLSVFVIFSSPVVTIQMAIAKYTAKFNAIGDNDKIKFLLSDFFKKALFLSVFTFLTFLLLSHYLVGILKIPTLTAGYILAVLLALICLTPVFSGGVQGLEFFGWFSFSSVLSGILKLTLVFLFLLWGYNISGCLSALLLSTLLSLVIFYLPLRNFFVFEPKKKEIDYREIGAYLLPVAVTNFCYANLVNSDIIWVKYFFTPGESGFYSIAQMAGKIFLFLPGAISVVMFPRASGLAAKNLDTLSTLRRSLIYGLALSVLAAILYNFFPSFALRVLAGKAYPEAVFLGRLFSFSMTFYAILFILITYFLSVKDFRFIKYLVFFTILQNLIIFFFHPNLASVQLVLCAVSFILFSIHLTLIFKARQWKT